MLMEKKDKNNVTFLFTLPSLRSCCSLLEKGNTGKKRKMSAKG
jgi:hypothetical protein